MFLDNNYSYVIEKHINSIISTKCVISRPCNYQDIEHIVCSAGQQYVQSLNSLETDRIIFNMSILRCLQGAAKNKNLIQICCDNTENSDMEYSLSVNMFICKVLIRRMNKYIKLSEFIEKWFEELSSRKANFYNWLDKMTGYKDEIYLVNAVTIAFGI
jgi:hypothetical protein